jgi:hypothetical protein
VQKIVDGECEEEERDEEEMIETGGPDGGGTDTVVAMEMDEIEVDNSAVEVKYDT